MILKLHDPVINDSFFFDGFDQISSEIKYKDTARDYSCPVSIFVNKNDHKSTNTLKISLASKDNILKRIIFVDDMYNIYLLSDTGKTIERIN